GDPADPNEADVAAPLRTFLRRCAGTGGSGAFRSTSAALDALPHLEKPLAPPAAPRRRFRRPRLVHALAGGAALAALPFAIVALNLDRSVLQWPESGDRIDSIAVLPLESGAGDEDRVFADGFGDALIMSLSRVAGLQVISRTSSRRYLGRPLALSRIADELGVDAVVEGSVSRDSDRVRVSVRLLDALTGRELWAATYDRSAADVPQLQGEVAADIVRKVEVQVTPEESYRIRRSRVVDPAAHEAYLQGQHHLERRTPNGLEVGLRYLRNAVETDPGYALAWAGLANGYALLASTGYDGLAPREAMPEARQAAERAVRLDDQLAETHTALAQVLNNYEWDWPAAERSFRRAIELGPGFSTARQWYGFHLAAVGRLDESLEMMESARALDPLSPLACTSVGRVHYYRGEMDEAVAHFEEALTLDPHFLPAYILLGLAHTARGETDEALRSFERGRDLFAGAPAFTAGVGVAHASAGREADALQAVATLAEARGGRYVPAIYTAALYAALGRTDEAFAWLDRAVEERSEAVTFLAVEPLFLGLRDDPRFDELLERVGVPAARSPVAGSGPGIRSGNPE
ncbi:MAG TPA: tetratricopeptide repeat protein, partial [bacterium]|nr:tetratricopeptide repeat protein [bacterium]